MQRKTGREPRESERGDSDILLLRESEREHQSSIINVDRGVMLMRISVKNFI
jgi:hypothetical protein